MSGGAQGTRVPLTHPIQAHGETVSELDLRRPKLGDLEGVSLVLQPKPAGQEGTDIKIVLGDAIPVIAAMARIPPSAARTIDIEDVGEVMKVVWDFLPKSLATT